MAISKRLSQGKTAHLNLVKNILAELKARDITPVETVANKVSENSEDMVLPPADEMGMGGDLDTAADPEDTTVPSEEADSDPEEETEEASEEEKGQGKTEVQDKGRRTRQIE